MRERPLSSVPKPIFIILLIAIMIQIGWVQQQETAKSQLAHLTMPTSTNSMRLASLGEPIGLSKLAMLYLQAFDRQDGKQISFKKLNYEAVQAWLTRIIELDPKSQYPLFAASHLYAEIADKEKQRMMLDFIYQQFLKDPQNRWRSLAHAATLAKHRLKDLELARQYAQAIRIHATSPDVPSWAKQMEIFILEDMNELESAKILLGGLLSSEKIKDPHEFQFLEQRLKELEERTAK